MSNRIPTAARLAVKERDEGRCSRCGGLGSEWHHRRRRNVRNDHYQHCCCIGVLLCTVCHRWVHANPAKARDTGYIISSYEEEPWTIPLQVWTKDWQTNDCEGDFTLSREKEH